MYNLRDIFPFSSVSNEDLYSVFQTHCQTSDNPQNHDSEELFANTLNENSENFNLEIYDDSDLSIPLGSQYYTENMFVTKTQSRSINNCCILHMNIRSMNKNFEKLKIFLDKAQCERAIIGITETWFSGSPHSMYSLSGYNMITNSRQKKRGGGVALYIPTHFEYEVKNDLTVMTDSLETLFIEICVIGDKNIVVGIVYRPPQSHTEEFILGIQNILSHPIFTSKSCLLMGDFNADLLKYDSNAFVMDFVSTMASFSLLPLITKPTRAAENSKTIIDNVFCNMQPFPDAGIILSDISDHYPIFALCSLAQKQESGPHHNKNQRKITPRNVNNFKAKLGNVDWTMVLNEEDVNISYEKFWNIFIQLYNEAFPIQNRKLSSYKKTP